MPNTIIAVSMDISNGLSSVGGLMAIRPGSLRRNPHYAFLFPDPELNGLMMSDYIAIMAGK